MKRAKLILLGILAVLVIAVLHYYLPQVDVVRIVGTDIKRVDTPPEGTDVTADAAPSSTDVYFILSETQSGAVRNYRNEDALLYGKFDSSDLHTRARSIGQNEGNLVAIRHYGWRITFLSMFPNAVAVWEVEPGYRHLPIFNILFLTLLFGGIGYIVFRVRRFGRRIADERAAREAEREAERAAEEARRAQDRVPTDTGPLDRDKALQDFFSDDGHKGG